LAADPAIKKVFDVGLFQWYCSAALHEYLPVADKIWKDKP
jgi:hypothetical protein